MGKTKLTSLQIGRSFAILTVLLYHLIPIEKKYFSSNLILPAVFKLGNIGVDVFFILSGIVIYLSSKKYYKSEVLTYLKRRMKRVYLPYWFYFFLLLPVYFIFPDRINSSQNGEVNLLKSFLLFPDKNLPLLIVAWSLIHELYFYISYSLKIRFKQNIGLYIITMIGIGVIARLININNDPLLKLISSPLNIEFLFGLLIGKYIIPIIQTISRRVAITTVILNTTGIVSCLYFALITPVLGPYRLLLYGIPAGLFIISLMIFEINLKFKFSKYLVSLGDASYSLYLNHILSLNLIALIFSRLIEFNSGLINAIGLTMILILSILIGQISYKLIEKPILEKFN